MTHTLVVGSAITANTEASTSDGVLTSHSRVWVSNSTFTNRRLPKSLVPIGAAARQSHWNQQIWQLVELARLGLHGHQLGDRAPVIRERHRLVGAFDVSQQGIEAVFAWVLVTVVSTRTTLALSR